MDWLYVLMPISGCTIFWPGLIILGLGVGIIGGFFGMGGAWMVTPGLNILGFPMAFAIGTDVAHMAGKSLISTMRHGKFGNVDYKLGLTMLVGTVIGMEIGAQIVMLLERLGNVDKVVRWLYVVLLICLAWMVFHDIAVRKRKEREAAARGEVLDEKATGIDWASKLHAIKIPPMVHFHQAGIYCSAWLPIFVSFATGVLAGIGGFFKSTAKLIIPKKREKPAPVATISSPPPVVVGKKLERPPQILSRDPRDLAALESMPGYVKGGPVSDELTPYRIAGAAWRAPTTYYYMGGRIVTGDRVNEKLIEKGSYIFYKGEGAADESGSRTP